ncbi:Tetratricopeptide repeat-containing protein [Desulfonatronum zhilinae]|nr:Tetratricopeptide repeat-containing protein [Desulfonatronum zhilinae]
MSHISHLRSYQRTGESQKLTEYLASHPELDFVEQSQEHALLAMIRFLRNEQSQAMHHFHQVVEDELDDSESLADFAFCYFAVNQPAKALELLQRAALMKDASSVVHQRLGGVSLAMNKIEEAESAYKQSLLLEPERPEVLSNMGGIKLRQGDLEASLDYYTRALQLKPDLEITRNQRGQVMIALQRVDELIEEKEARLSEHPEEPTAHLELAMVLLQAERFSEAFATLDAAVDKFPDESKVRMAYVQLCFQQKMWWQAGEKLLEWSKDDPSDMNLRLLLNEARLEAGFTDTVRKDLEEIADDAAGLPKYILLQSKILVDEAKAEEALALLTEASDRFPGAVEVKYQLYEVLTSLGRLDEAEAVVQEAGLLNPSGIARRVESKGHDIDDLELEALRRVAENPVMPGPHRSGAMFTLAKVYDKRKNYSASFETVIQANDLMRSSIRYNWKAHRKAIQDLITTFTPDLVTRLQGLGHPSKRPIFITGMPRSGTTLTEQILCSHPQVYGAGELHWMTRLTRLVPKVLPNRHYPEAMNAFGREHLYGAADYYLQRIAQQNDTADYVVDKMPHNFDHIGLIALIFPNVPIIHMKRDIRDVAVSNYYQNFAAFHGLMGFAYNLEDIGHMLNDHERIMAHWHELFPGRIFELDYQELVRNPESTIRSLMDHCGLEWDKRVLKFYETKRPVRTASIRQVRQGIYTSSAEKWRRYEQYLEPLERVLADGFKTLEESVDTSTAFIAGPTL